VFDQWLVIDRPDVKVLLQDRYTGHPIVVGNRTILDHQAPALWFVFPDAWFDIGRFHLRDGTFTGWYTNICTPVSIRGDRWFSTDLFLDCWIWKTGEYEWLDEDEFSTAVHDGALDRSTSERVVRERQRIQHKYVLQDWPPAITRDIDIKAALDLL